MPYQLDDKEIQLILPLFDTHGSQAMTSTSQQQLSNLRLKLLEAFSLDGSANLTVSDDLNYQTEDNTVSSECYFLPKSTLTSFL
jgi:hypothetical protein